MVGARDKETLPYLILSHRIVCCRLARMNILAG